MSRFHGIFWAFTAIALVTMIDALAAIKVEWHLGDLFARVGFLVTNLSRPAERAVAFYNQRGTADRWIKEGKNVVKWTQLSCSSMTANAVRLQLHALAYNVANFLRTVALPARSSSGR
jgi:hypothetical protein